MNRLKPEENLQVIRTLMERATLYRRALRPIMGLAGIGALLIAVMGRWFHDADTAGFAVHWFAGGVGVAAGALVLSRRQALRDREPFWSLPARRVILALVPPLSVGVIVTVLLLFETQITPPWLVAFWALLYGCGLHAAGFFAPRGLQKLGFGFLFCGVSVAGCPWLREGSPHLLMGSIFGGLHLGYALYLTVTTRES